jgi:hypothetical protein
MAQENENVLHAALHCVSTTPAPTPPDLAPVFVVASTGVEVASLTRPSALIFRFMLNEAIADEELTVSMAVDDGEGLTGTIANWRRVAGDLTQRHFEVEAGALVLIMPPPSPASPVNFCIQFWRIPKAGPPIAFPEPPPT